MLVSPSILKLTCFCLCVGFKDAVRVHRVPVNPNFFVASPSPNLKLTVNRDNGYIQPTMVSLSTQTPRLSNEYDPSPLLTNSHPINIYQCELSLGTWTETPRPSAIRHPPPHHFAIRVRIIHVPTSPPGLPCELECPPGHIRDARFSSEQ